MAAALKGCCVVVVLTATDKLAAGLKEATLSRDRNSFVVDIITAVNAKPVVSMRQLTALPDELRECHTVSLSHIQQAKTLTLGARLQTGN